MIFTEQILGEPTRLVGGCLGVSPNRMVSYPSFSTISLTKR